jgi:hypothetical protein
VECGTGKRLTIPIDESPDSSAARSELNFDESIAGLEGIGIERVDV